MYLSRVEIDVSDRHKTSDLTHLGAFHNWVEQSFPEEITAEKRKRHLWRIDKLAGKEYLLVLSESVPNLELFTKYGITETAVTKSYDQFLDSIQEGQLMQFRLTANPTYTVSQPGQKQGRIFPHVTVEQQCQWLVKRAEKSGFQLVEQEMVDIPGAPTSKDFKIISRDHPMLHRKAGRGVRLSRVTFEGMLRVANIADFKQTLTKGLGREKAFGIGLMTVIPEA